MLVFPIHTRKFLPPQDDLYQLLEEYCLHIQSKDILVLSSKIVAIHQGRTLAKKDTKDIVSVQQAESEYTIPYASFQQHNTQSTMHPQLSIKYNTLTPMAGIDESNANGYYVLWPTTPFSEAKTIQETLCSQYHLDSLGIIISDSFLIPMRYGSVGISLGFYGIAPIKDYRNSKDIFGRTLHMSQLNIVDSLATIANYSMGEGNEQIPIVLLRDVERVVFTHSNQEEHLFIPKEEDIYAPLLAPYMYPQKIVQPNNADIQIQEKE